MELKNEKIKKNKNGKCRSGHFTKSGKELAKYFQNNRRYSDNFSKFH